jgi:CRISPR-associated protein Csh2
MSSTPESTVENRSEIVFITDAQDCNPNGNPMGENRPRIDPVTNTAIVTDVRLKRYLRDQLASDGHPIFVKKTGDESTVRARLALDLFEDVESADDLDAIEDISQAFLEKATDVRYFGATLSFNVTDDDLLEAVKEQFPSEFTGPVQFSPARSMNAVETNEESSKLTSVIATQEDKSQGGFGLDDHRIKYGIFPFHGIVDEHGAADTNLSTADVDRLDTLCWRAMKNQTLSRSKLGQEPRIYVRVEYSTPGYHLGDLHHGMTIDEDASVPDSEMRDIRDVTLNVTDFLNWIGEAAADIDTVHVAGSNRLAISYGERDATAADLPALLEEQGVSVHGIDVYDEFERTLPAE